MSRYRGLYTEINFVPDWYVSARRRRRNFGRQTAVLTALVLVLSVFVIQNWRERDALALYHGSLVERLQSTQGQITEVGKLLRARAELSRQLKIHRKLHQPVSYSQITGTLAHLMPQSVTLRSLEVRTEQVTVTAKAAAPAKGRNGARPATQTYPVVTVEIEGIAPSDGEVANFIGALSSAGLFDNVKMIYARQGTHQNLIVRQFRIRLEVPLDREYQPRHTEVADAQ